MRAAAAAAGGSAVLKSYAPPSDYMAALALGVLVQWVVEIRSNGAPRWVTKDDLATGKRQLVADQRNPLDNRCSVYCQDVWLEIFHR